MRNTDRSLHEGLPADFESWWALPEKWVEIPNQRRNGWSGMIRLPIGESVYFIKKQCNHLYRSLRHPFGWPTVSREFANILQLQALGIRVPEPVFLGSRHKGKALEALLVTRELAGFKALADLGPLDAPARAILARETGRVLGRMHRAHLQHSCLYDKHIMVRWEGEDPEIALIDLEKLRRPLFPWRAAWHDLDQLKRHQRLWSSDEWRLLEEAHRQSPTRSTP